MTRSTYSQDNEDENTTAIQGDELSRLAHVPKPKPAFAKLPNQDQKALKEFVEARKAERSSIIKVTHKTPNHSRETPRALDGNKLINNTHETPDETRETLRALSRVLNTKPTGGSSKITSGSHGSDETRDILRALARVLNTKSTMVSDSTTERKYSGSSIHDLEGLIAEKRKKQISYREELKKLENASSTPEGKIEEIHDKILDVDVEVKEIESEVAQRKKNIQENQNPGSGSGSGSGSGGFDDSGLGSSGLGDESGLDKKPEATSTTTKESGQPPDEFNDSNVFSSTGLGDTSSGPSKDNEAEGLFVAEDASQDDFHSFQGGEGHPEAGDKGTPEDPDAGLFTPEQADKAAGRRSDGVVTHWRKQGNANHVIVSYGPPSARRYIHTTSSKAGKNFDKKNTPRFGPAFRYGDKKDEDGNHIRSRDEFRGFLGEAYTGDVEGLRPKRTWTDSKGKKRVEKRKFPITDLHVQWLIGGEVKRAWETRSSIKHLWTSPEECDKDIYNSAKFHAAEHKKWLIMQMLPELEDSLKVKDGNDEDDDENGSDEGDDEDGSDVASERSTPTPREKGKGREAKEKNGNKKKGVTPKKKNDTAADDEDDDIKKMLRFQKRWCAMKGINAEKMTSQQEIKFLQVWDSRTAEA